MYLNKSCNLLKRWIIIHSVSSLLMQTNRRAKHKGDRSNWLSAKQNVGDWIPMHGGVTETKCTSSLSLNVCNSTYFSCALIGGEHQSSEY